jgi:hypothetical protein
VVPGPHLDPLVVEDLADVVRVHALDLEGDRSPAVLHGRRPEDAHAGDVGEQRQRVRG